MRDIILIIILAAYTGLSLFYSFKLFKSDLLSKSKQAINILMVWLLPFIWIVIIREMLFKRTKGSYEVGVKNDVSSNQFHESQEGFNSQL